MSHFCTLVVTDNLPSKEELQEILLPWHEYECTGIDRYCQWIDETDEFTEYFNTKKVKYVKLKNDQLVDYYDQQFWNEKYNKFTLPPGARKLELTKAEADEDLFIAAKQEGYEAIPDLPNRFGRYTNPNKKWDWWSIGGRYGNRLIPYDTSKAFRDEEHFQRYFAKEITKKGFDQCQKGNLNLDAMLDVSIKECTKAWQESQKFPLRNLLYGIPKECETLEDVLKIMPKAINCFAFIVNGTWYEHGKMGWFGAVFDEKDLNEWQTSIDGMFQAIDKDQWINVIDCHI